MLYDAAADTTAAAVFSPPDHWHYSPSSRTSAWYKHTRLDGTTQVMLTRLAFLSTPSPKQNPSRRLPHLHGRAWEGESQCLGCGVREWTLPD